MTLGFSTFLDITRFFAAIVVMLSHFGSETISHSIFYIFGFISHSAVLVFFVLSGYVISFVTEKKENSLATYALSRFCRIYSVVIPAIVLTVVVDLWGRSINPVPYRPYSYFETSAGFHQIVSSLFFMDENWWSNYSLFSNGSFWSLNNEVWYYIMFAIIFWSRSAYARYFLISCSVIIVGPKIVLLSPVWFFGVAVRRLERRFDISARSCCVIFSACVLTVLAGDLLEREVPWFPWIEAPDLHFFGAAIAIPIRDYATGLLISIAFLAASRLVRDWAPVPSLLRVIRWCAGMTFSIYLFHRPLLLFLAAVLPGSTEDNGKRITILTVAAIVIVILSYLTERQKDRLKSGVIVILRYARQLRWRTA